MIVVFITCFVDSNSNSGGGGNGSGGVGGCGEEEVKSMGQIQCTGEVQFTKNNFSTGSTSQMS